MVASSSMSISAIDSERFGVVVARANDVTADAVPAVLAFANENDVELTIARCDGRDQGAARALTAAGLSMLEGQIVYRGPLAPAGGVTGIREGVSEDREALAELARDAFTDLVGHYHADPRLSPNACRDVYVDWTLRGLAGEAADAFYVAEVDGRPAAFGMFTFRGEDVIFVLSAVAPSAHGRGLYRAMLDRGMAWGLERGAQAVVGVVAHGTVAAHRSLIKAGMRPVAAISTFHGWRDQLATAE
jgi:hypothetical protein